MSYGRPPEVNVGPGRPTVVVIGSGSAGLRHASALRKRLPDAELYVVRRAGSVQPAEPFAALGAELIPTIDQAMCRAPTLGVVASPAPFHRGGAELLLAAGAQVLVEKPLAHDVGHAQAITRAAHAHNREILVGYHLRFGTVVPHLRALIESGEIGEPKAFRFAVGQHLDQWRPGADPRQSVTARKDLGGGVLLELSHELDGVQYLLGNPTSVSARLSYEGAPTDGLVETSADITLQMKNGIAGTVHLDMVSRTPMRRWEVKGTSGELVADLLTGRLILLDEAGQLRETFPSKAGERDRAEDRLIANLIATARGRERSLCTGADGVAALRIVHAAQASALSGGPVAVPIASPGIQPPNE